jgi:hypothetical protein
MVGLIKNGSLYILILVFFFFFFLIKSVCKYFFYWEAYSDFIYGFSLYFVEVHIAIHVPMVHSLLGLTLPHEIQDFAKWY